MNKRRRRLLALLGTAGVTHLAGCGSDDDGGTDGTNDLKTTTETPGDGADDTATETVAPTATLTPTPSPTATETPPDGTTYTVVITDGLVFDPDSLTIAPGDTVVFENVGTIGHSVTAYEDSIPEGAEYWASGGFDSEDAARSAYSASGSIEDSGNVPGGESWERTFETEGTHEYFCIPHENVGMGGSITVRPDDSGTATETPPDGSEFDIGMIYTLRGTGIEWFEDAANAGINQAAEQFNITFDDAGPQSTDEFNTFQTEFAESTDPDYDLIICLGFEHVPSLQDNADTYPDQHWALLDSTLPESKPNVESWLYGVNEGAYIAGEAAATLSSQEFSAGGGQTDPSETRLGFVGGAEVPPVQEFEAGFRAGMNSVNEDFELLTAYVGSFGDPDAVETAANSMIDSGADVLLDGAGPTGSGVFQACQDNSRFAFGADARQSETASEFSNVILGSIIRGVDQSVINAVQRVVNGEFKGGQTFTLTAGEGGFEVPWGVDIGGEIPQEVKDQADETIQAIADGEINVPSMP